MPGNTKPAHARAGLHKWYVLHFDEEQDLDEAAERLAAVAEIQTVQYSTERQMTFDGKAYPFRESPRGETRSLIRSDFNDPNLFWQWHYINNADQAVATTARVGADVNVAEAWKLTGGDPRVIVAIVDEGVKYTHPDLAANMWTNPSPSPEYGNQDIHGWNFVENGPVTWGKFEVGADGKKTGDTGHGTHVAGTVAAVNNNGLGVGRLYARRHGEQRRCAPDVLPDILGKDPVDRPLRKPCHQICCGSRSLDHPVLVWV